MHTSFLDELLLLLFDLFDEAIGEADDTFLTLFIVSVTLVLMAIAVPPVNDDLDEFVVDGFEPDAVVAADAAEDDDLTIISANDRCWWLFLTIAVAAPSPPPLTPFDDPTKILAGTSWWMFTLLVVDELVSSASSSNDSLPETNTIYIKIKKIHRFHLPN